LTAGSAEGGSAARAAAFFDLDKTLIAGSSALDFARAARSAGWIRRRDMLRFGAEHVRYRLRGTSDEATEALLAEVTALLRGRSERELIRMGPQVLAGILPRVYPRMLEEVNAHQDAGRLTFIVSAASDRAVRIVADVLGMDDGIGTRYEVDAAGRYTGRLDGPFMYGPGKREAIERYAREHGIDLAASYAYSDSASDLPMLRAVGHPVAVNPDPALARVAAEEGWEVLRFEKLGTRLKIAAATLTAAAVGGLAGLAATRRPPRRQVPLAGSLRR